MISDALWSDYDKDGKVDLVLAGEWMPMTFLKNTGAGFNLSKTTGVEQHTGWWNSLAAGDFDSDGDVDYVAGNLGLNSNFKATPQEPMTLLAKDLDENGKMDLMVFCYLRGEDGSRKPFPMHARDDMVSQLVSIRKQYPSFKSYGRASITNLWKPKDREGAVVLQANHMNTSYIENRGNGQFSITPLPLEAQVAPVFGMAADDVDGDGRLDLLLVGNDYGMEPGSGRHDAFNGLYLKGDGTGHFAAIPTVKSGFFVPGDGKALAFVHTKAEDLFVATQNGDSILVYAKKPVSGAAAAKWIELLPDDFCADITYRDNRKQHVEFQYGSTFLSQSSRVLRLDANVSKVALTNFKGATREINN
jgi:hypothetical protein